MSNENGYAIETQGLVKKFGDFTAVAGLDLGVETGEIFGLLGPNGSGKTTTIRMILGLVPPTAGSVEVLDIAVAEAPERIRPQIGYMSQRFSLYNDLTVLQNLRFYGAAYGVPRDDLGPRIDDALTLAGLKGREKIRTRDLSGGWRQRLALSASILHRPRVLFLDEPTAGVDPLSRRAFWELLYDLVREGVTIFVTTHYMDEAEHCHHLAFLQRGHRIAYGSPREIKEEAIPGQVLEIEPSDAVAAARVLQAAVEAGVLSLEDVSLYGALVHVVAEDFETIETTIRKELKQADIEVESMTVLEPSLEDVFIASMR